VELERVREGEPEEAPARLYEPELYRYTQEWVKRQHEGVIVVRRRERPYDIHRQVSSRRYLSPLEPELRANVLQDWEVFQAEFTGRTGKHRHQGGLGIFILEGTGYTVMDGVRHDWTAGDLVVLPMKPGGIEHQHFASEPDGHVRWIAFVYWPFFHHGGCENTQIESCPQFEQYVQSLPEGTAGGAQR
jgi:quercetin dioxygenase-like cupin family protein